MKNIFVTTLFLASVVTSGCSAMRGTIEGHSYKTTSFDAHTSKQLKKYVNKKLNHSDVESVVLGCGIGAVSIEEVKNQVLTDFEDNVKNYSMPRLSLCLHCEKGQEREYLNEQVIQECKTIKKMIDEFNQKNKVPRINEEIVDMIRRSKALNVNTMLVAIFKRINHAQLRVSVLHI